MVCKLGGVGRSSYERLLLGFLLELCLLFIQKINILNNFPIESRGRGVMGLDSELTLEKTYKP